MKLLITRKIPDAGIRLIQKHPEIELIYKQGAPLSEKELVEKIKDVDAIIPVIPDKINEKVIKAAKNLKIIATYSVGYDHIDVDTATSKKIYVGNTPGSLTEAVAEHALALLLAVGRKVIQADKYCRQDNYKYWDPMLFMGPRFFGKTVGIVGAGRIGEQFARICKYGLNMDILYSDPSEKFEMGALLDAKRVDLDELLTQSDVISLHCNLCDATKGMINHTKLKLMKPDAILLNTARGKVVNEAALVEALENNYILGAGIDVFENEPEIHPKLKKLENVVMSPHIASATWEARIEMSTMAAQNVIDVLIHNKQPSYLVNTSLSESVDTIA